MLLVAVVAERVHICDTKVVIASKSRAVSVISYLLCYASDGRTIENLRFTHRRIERT